MYRVLSTSYFGEAAMPISPPSPRLYAASMVCTVWTTPPGVIDLILRVSRSVNSALPSGRNASPHGASRFLASTWIPTSSSGLSEPALGDGEGGRFGGLPCAASSGSPNAQPPAPSRASAASTATARRPGRRVTGRRSMLLRLSAGAARFRSTTIAIRPRNRADPRLVQVKVWIPHEEGLDLLGELSPVATVEVYPGGDELPSDPGDVEFWVPPFLSDGRTTLPLDRFTSLAVIQLLSAGADSWVGRVPPGVLLCDAAGVHTSSTAEWVVTAILSSIREFPRFVRAQVERRWDYTGTDELAGKRVLVVGAGTIGEGIRRRLEPFDVELTLAARRARPGVHA